MKNMLLCTVSCSCSASLGISLYYIVEIRKFFFCRLFNISVLIGYLLIWSLTHQLKKCTQLWENMSHFHSNFLQWRLPIDWKSLLTLLFSTSRIKLVPDESFESRNSRVCVDGKKHLVCYYLITLTHYVLFVCRLNPASKIKWDLSQTDEILRMFDKVSKYIAFLFREVKYYLLKKWRVLLSIDSSRRRFRIQKKN